ncbi:hypothetical protein B0O99DRAFT_691528 [Bisporella sp. PMI_857]|nr:hypothetical protein B0O99DRAFT_691528 [Bisporella sp. PMI_857]
MSNEHFITPAILLPGLRRPELPRHLDSIEHLDDEQRQRFLISMVNTATSLEVFFQNACQNDRNRETTTFGRQHRMLSALASYNKRRARHLIYAKEAKTTLNILERLELSFANHRPQLPDTFHSLPSDTVSEMAMQLNWHSKPRDKSPEPYLSTDPISCKKPWHPRLLKYVTAAVGIIAIPKSGIHVPLMATTADKFTSISQLEQWSRKCFNYRNKSLSQAINKEYKAKGIKPEIDWKILMKNRRELEAFTSLRRVKKMGAPLCITRWLGGMLAIRTAMASWTCRITALTHSASAKWRLSRGVKAVYMCAYSRLGIWCL